jgi:hypothetical protein
VRCNGCSNGCAITLQHESVAESALLSRAHQLRRPATASCFLCLPNTRWGRSVSDPVIVKVGDLFADVSAFTGTHDRVVPARASHLKSFIHVCIQNRRVNPTSRLRKSSGQRRRWARSRRTLRNESIRCSGGSSALRRDAPVSTKNRKETTAMYPKNKSAAM